MSISLKVVRAAAVFCDSLRRSAIRFLIRDTFTRRSVRLPGITGAADDVGEGFEAAGAGGAGEGIGVDTLRAGAGASGEGFGVGASTLISAVFGAGAGVGGAEP